MRRLKHFFFSLECLWVGNRAVLLGCVLWILGSCWNPKVQWRFTRMKIKTYNKNIDINKTLKTTLWTWTNDKKTINAKSLIKCLLKKVGFEKRFKRVHLILNCTHKILFMCGKSHLAVISNALYFNIFHALSSTISRK